MKGLAPRDAVSTPWVLVAGGIHREGAMDKANAALAHYLCARKVPLHLVAHGVESSLAANPAVTLHRVRMPLGSFLIGQRGLSNLGRAIACNVTARFPRARVVVNGGNCEWPDINWVHCLHYSWQPTDGGAPLWFKIKNRFEKRLARRDEFRALSKARCVVTNSQRTRRDLIQRLRIPDERVHTIYLGTDSGWKTVSHRREAAREWLGEPAGRPLVAFIGALGYDSNKGFDKLWAVWQALCARDAWDANLIVAGGGRALPALRKTVERAGMDRRVTFLGFTDRISDVLAASDLLVSPVRYESYGLNVQEALCCGVPAMVSASAGIAERYPAEIHDLLLPDPEDAGDLAARMLRWRSNMESVKERIEPTTRMLRGHTWDDMARQIVELVEPEAPI